MFSFIRYITWPGQATAYKVGERVLHKLRCKAEDALKDKFDPRDFYDVVLRCGPIPLFMLEKLVDEYINSKMSSINMADAAVDANRKTSEMENTTPDLSFLSAFNWCKCCTVPGSCQLAKETLKE
jgi:hypothetical protein